jgi:hypothetical protein
MKHGFLITAYKNEIQLVNLVKDLDNKDSYFYIHIDKKSSLLKERIIQKFKLRANVKILEKSINVNWGGFSHLKAIVLLIETALANPEISFFHTLSGQCFPIKPLNEIFDFFEKNKQQEFIDFTKMPTAQLFEGGLNRLFFFRPNDIFNEKGTYIERKIYSSIIKLQKLLNVKRPYSKEFPPLYWGSTWWSLSRECLEFVDLYIKDNPDFYERFKFTFCAEEMFFQTILANSSFKDKITNDNLRFIDWKERNGNSPANLDESDYDILVNSNKLFARKFETPISLKLIQSLIANKQ